MAKIVTGADRERVTVNTLDVWNKIAELEQGKTNVNTELEKKADKSIVETLSSQMAQSQTKAESEKAGIAGWARGGTKDKKIVVVGDSTSDGASGGAQFLYECFNVFYKNSGDLLDGVTIVDKGSSGNTLQNFLNDTASPKGINAVIAEQADLYILSYGINDVRLGATTQQQMIDRLKTAVERLLKETKGYVLLRIPNSFLSDDPGATGWVTPLASAQAYTDLLWNAYMNFVTTDKYPRVDVIDMQTLVFGRTVQPMASNPLMNDILHPNKEGYYRIARNLANFIGKAPSYRDDLAVAAKTANATSPYLVYPKILEVETEKYELIAQGYFVGMASNYLDFSFPGTEAYKIRKGDIIKVGDELAYDFSTGTATASGANTRFAGGITFANYANNRKGIVKIFRKKVVPAVKRVFDQTDINGKNLGYFMVDQMRMKTISCSATTYIPTTVTLKLRRHYAGSIYDIATLAYTANNPTPTVTWDATNAPNGYFDATGTEVFSLDCVSTTQTGLLIWALTITS